MSERNKAVVRRLVAEVPNGWIASFLASFPDVRKEIIDLIVEADHVVSRFSCSLPLLGDWLGLSYENDKQKEMS